MAIAVQTTAACSDPGALLPTPDLSSAGIEWLQLALLDAERTADGGSVVLINRRTRTISTLAGDPGTIPEEMRSFEFSAMSHDNPCEEEENEEGKKPGCCERESAEETDEWDQCIDELLADEKCDDIVFEVHRRTGMRRSYCRETPA